MKKINTFTFVQSLGCVQLFVTPWMAAFQASLSFFQSLLKLKSIELVMPSNHLILCCPLLLLPSIFPSIRVFYSESALCIRWPKDWKFPSKEQVTFNFMAAVTIHSDFRGQKNKICHHFHFTPSICHEVMGADAMILDF